MREIAGEGTRARDRESERKSDRRREIATETARARERAVREHAAVDLEERGG